MLIEESHFYERPFKDLEIVLDLDMTLIYSTIEKPAPGEKNVHCINIKELGIEIYVYKRPYLD